MGAIVNVGAHLIIEMNLLTGTALPVFWRRVYVQPFCGSSTSLLGLHCF